MGFIGHDPERLSRLAVALTRVVDGLDSAVVGLPVHATHDLVRVAGECERVSRRVIDSLRVLEDALVRHSSSRLDELVGGDDMWWLDVVHPRTDVVDEALRVDAGALIDDTTDDAAIAALVFGTTDTAAVRGFWLSATDPTVVPPSVARDRVLKLVRAVVNRDWQTYVTGHRTMTAEHWRIDHEAVLLAAEVATAWQIRFTGLARTWDLDPTEGRNLLTALAADADAAACLSRGLPDAVWRELSNPPRDPMSRRRLVDDVAFAVGASTEIARAAEVDRAVADDAVVDSLVHLPLRLPVGVPWIASTVLGVGADEMSRALSSADETSRRAALTEVARRDLLAGLAVAALWRAAVARGRVSPDSRALPRDVELELQHARDSISNQAGRGDAFASQ